MPVQKRSETLKYTVTTSGEPYQDANGNWITPEPVTVTMEIPCRSEANTSGKPVTLPDGTQLQYAFAIYLDVDAEVVPAQMPITIYQGARKVGEGTVKRFHRWQKYSAIWV